MRRTILGPSLHLADSRTNSIRPQLPQTTLTTLTTLTTHTHTHTHTNTNVHDVQHFQILILRLAVLLNKTNEPAAARVAEDGGHRCDGCNDLDFFYDGDFSVVRVRVQCSGRGWWQVRPLADVDAASVPDAMSGPTSSGVGPITAPASRRSSSICLGMKRKRARAHCSLLPVIHIDPFCDPGPLFFLLSPSSGSSSPRSDAAQSQRKEEQRSLHSLQRLRNTGISLLSAPPFLAPPLLSPCTVPFPQHRRSPLRTMAALVVVATRHRFGRLRCTLYSDRCLRFTGWRSVTQQRSAHLGVPVVFQKPIPVDSA